MKEKRKRGDVEKTDVLMESTSLDREVNSREGNAEKRRKDKEDIAEQTERDRRLWERR